jgi:cytochrome c553
MRAIIKYPEEWGPVPGMRHHGGILAGRTVIFAAVLRCFEAEVWMSVRSLLAIAVVGLVLSVSAEAAGDPARGKTLGYTCLGCHGIDNYKSVYPTFSVPRLRGQHPEYIIAALKGYKSGERSHATMHAHAATMSDQDMEDIAAYLGGTPVKAAAGAKPVGKAPAAVATCQACHGLDGVGLVGMYPTLSGQHADYLEHSLASYRSGARKNGIMAPFAAQLKPEDIKEVAEYFAHQQPALKTVPKKEKAAAAK